METNHHTAIDEARKMYAEMARGMRTIDPQFAVECQKKAKLAYCFRLALLGMEDEIIGNVKWRDILEVVPVE
jgi:hypothetical protein